MLAVGAYGDDAHGHVELVFEELDVVGEFRRELVGRGDVSEVGFPAFVCVDDSYAFAFEEDFLLVVGFERCKDGQGEFCG